MALIATDERLEQSLRAADAAVSWAQSMFKVADDSGGASSPVPTSAEAPPALDLSEIPPNDLDLLESAKKVKRSALASADGAEDDLDWRARFDALSLRSTRPNSSPAAGDVLARSIDALDAAQLAHRCGCCADVLGRVLGAGVLCSSYRWRRWGPTPGWCVPKRTRSWS